MTRRHFNRRKVLGAGLAGAWGAGAKPLVVDLALVLAIDVSYSVDPDEYQIQMRGTGQALRSPQVLKAVASGPGGRIAISAFLWSDAVTKTVVLPWHILRDENDAISIGSFFMQVARSVEKGTTATGSALLFGESLLDVAPQATRQVIDISTDGTCNDGPPVPGVRDRLVARGITINGLAITKDLPYLKGYMEQDVMGGHNSFVVEANDFDAYGTALRDKLYREILNVDLI